MQKRSNANISKDRLTMHIEKLYVKETVENGKGNLGVKYHLIHVGWGRGDRGRETGRKGGGRCTGGGRRGSGKQDSQGGGKREKKGKITQHCTIFRNRRNAKGR